MICPANPSTQRLGNTERTRKQPIECSFGAEYPVVRWKVCETRQTGPGCLEMTALRNRSHPNSIGVALQKPGEETGNRSNSEKNERSNESDNPQQFPERKIKFYRPHTSARLALCCWPRCSRQSCSGSPIRLASCGCPLFPVSGGPGFSIESLRDRLPGVATTTNRWTEIPNRRGASALCLRCSSH